MTEKCLANWGRFMLLAEKHPLIERELSSGIGLKTQYIDSQIAEAVMLELLEQDVVVLPVHDLFHSPCWLPVSPRVVNEAPLQSSHRFYCHC